MSAIGCRARRDHCGARSFNRWGGTGVPVRGLSGSHTALLGLLHFFLTITRFGVVLGQALRFFAAVNGYGTEYLTGLRGPESGIPIELLDPDIYRTQNIDQDLVKIR